ncbi:MAG: hypothetical protein Q8P18_13020 [Pseudomonadota bacterium]|nr:hypothetical protein [Pseudomonadota bacterium]
MKRLLVLAAVVASGAFAAWLDASARANGKDPSVVLTLGLGLFLGVITVGLTTLFGMKRAAVAEAAPADRAAVAADFAWRREPPDRSRLTA